ncbi:hypothetical protein O181_088819 [Austropuccinia psidii MF-1]|uniref:Uncharacterized protein n=1 Tax=Austropuccinia psidii MF-1 TaxID=1389203 RepID=A0A9Q3ISC5_9BASI|nr:hypothetical protein [Austropuccinia psidii MF-1]
MTSKSILSKINNIKISNKSKSNQNRNRNRNRNRNPSFLGILTTNQTQLVYSIIILISSILILIKLNLTDSAWLISLIQDEDDGDEDDGLSLSKSKKSIILIILTFIVTTINSITSFSLLSSLSSLLAIILSKPILHTPIKFQAALNSFIGGFISISLTTIIFTSDLSIIGLHQLYILLLKSLNHSFLAYYCPSSNLNHSHSSTISNSSNSSTSTLKLIRINPFNHHSSTFSFQNFFRLLSFYKSTSNDDRINELDYPSWWPFNNQFGHDGENCDEFVRLIVLPGLLTLSILFTIFHLHLLTILLSSNSSLSSSNKDHKPLLPYHLNETKSSSNEPKPLIEI